MARASEQATMRAQPPTFSPPLLSHLTRFHLSSPLSSQVKICSMPLLRPSASPSYTTSRSAHTPQPSRTVLHVCVRSASLRSINIDLLQRLCPSHHPSFSLMTWQVHELSGAIERLREEKESAAAEAERQAEERAAAHAAQVCAQHLRTGNSSGRAASGATGTPSSL
jgi:hypothetical protein